MHVGDDLTEEYLINHPVGVIQTIIELHQRYCLVKYSRGYAITNHYEPSIDRLVCTSSEPKTIIKLWLKK